MLDKLLAKYNLNYEDLNAVERETLHTWSKALQTGQLTIDKIREYINRMLDGVISELTHTGLDKKKDTLLKARARNYTLLKAMLTSPEKAKEELEVAIQGIAEGVVG